MPTHFYTADPGERDNAIHNLGFSDEGTACWVFTAPAPGPAPLIYPLAPTPPPLNAQEAYSAEDFLAAVRRMAEKRVAGQDSPTVP